ncbi:MAG: bifunctional serine/threonine-protein kinase/formylglycine-generating enzyme family protein [Cyanobacteria bacterium P01_A01_bin.80]
MNTLVGRYEITETLGGGGFAITYLARDIMQPSKPLCVVKQLRPNQAHQQVIDFFYKEAAILEKLGKHPQIPRLLAHFEEGGNLYIVQEFIEGHDLSQEISPGKRLSEEYVSKLLQDVLEVLSFVHKYGVIHRDIKPQNLMRRREDGRIFLIDFGAVKELGSLVVNTQGEITSSVVIGTAGYMPSEQNLGKACFASDVYALGMTAISALTGLQPFQLEENPQTGEVIWLEKAEVSQHLAEVITKMVRRHHSLRFLSAQDALQALTSQATPIKSTQLSLPTSSPNPVSTPQPTTPKSPINLSRRKALQILGFAGGGFLLTVGGKRLFESLSLKLKTFEFQVVRVNGKGEITKRVSEKAKYFTEDLGNDVTLDMVEIPGGEFNMGSPEDEKDRDKDEGPQHKVTVKSFFMGKFAVTQAQYEAIMGENPSASGFRGKQRPVVSLNWYDATEFCKKLTEKTGKTYRLPSEAEWEYACRAETITPFHFGETITTDLANYRGTDWKDDKEKLHSGNYGNGPKGKYREETTEVGNFHSNAFGLYDMHGNVLEWCQDTWHKDYQGAPADGSAWVENGDDSKRVLRGGAWYNAPFKCRSAYRSYDEPHEKSTVFGFRVVCVSGRDS